ncbi:hypothetical protein H310_15301 [Aphanomyces invadans]|uniref:Uncharacterized protein n=1 Tax=Aphanomyces invadans TaxID=157072 RepID=A0A024T8F3_9STRA|nr:hypothetical protein H310_15301 [Aphanomyces invadans]ETV89861.1 hypothetical protein H310_15301 [Aphanomyces invadans]|eukprot:XP_008881507.1 hypothetical protein H310_15301 [Aphanomyces invadans]
MGAVLAVVVHGSHVNHRSIFLVATWRAWKCFGKITQPVRRTANDANDVECMSIDGMSRPL